LSSLPDPRRRSQSRGAATTLRWIGVGGASPTIEGIQSVNVDPDTTIASEGAPEWLVTNGFGGYASGTMTGLVTRRFHGYLVAALPAPRGRTMMLNHLGDHLHGRRSSTAFRATRSGGHRRAAGHVTRVPARARATGVDV
jgi:hypothetical protein